MATRDGDGFKKYVEAAAVLGRVTRARAEEIVHELVDAGEVQRGQAQEWVDDVVERSRKASEDLMHLVRNEVSRQLTAMGIDRDNLARQVADLVHQSAEAGRRAKSGATSTAKSTVTSARTTVKKVAAKAPTKKSATKKPAAKTAPAKKAAAKKAPAKKAAAKKAPGTKAAATTTKKAPAKKAGPASGAHKASS